MQRYDSYTMIIGKYKNRIEKGIVYLAYGEYDNTFIMMSMWIWVVIKTPIVGEVIPLHHPRKPIWYYCAYRVRGIHGCTNG